MTDGPNAVFALISTASSRNLEGWSARDTVKHLRGGLPVEPGVAEGWADRLVQEAGADDAVGVGFATRKNNGARASRRDRGELLDF